VCVCLVTFGITCLFVVWLLVGGAFCWCIVIVLCCCLLGMTFALFVYADWFGFGVVFAFCSVWLFLYVFLLWRFVGFLFICDFVVFGLFMMLVCGVCCCLCALWLISLVAPRWCSCAEFWVLCLVFRFGGVSFVVVAFGVSFVCVVYFAVFVC